MTLLDFDMDFNMDFGEETIPESKDINSKSVVRNLKRQTLFTKRNQDILDIFPKDIKEGESYHFISNGNFGNNEIMNAINKLYDIKNINLATWSINRDFVELIEKINPNSFNILIDKSIRTRKPAFYGMLSGLKVNKRITLVNGIHSKISLFECGDIKLIVEASANYSTNVKIEQYTIIRDEGLFEFHKEWLSKLTT